MITLQLGADGANPVAPQILPLITALVVFVVAFFVLSTKVWPKILGGLAAREKKIRDEIQSAEEARKRAEAAQAEFEKKLIEARQEATAMIQQARAEATRAADELRARNDAELASLRKRALADIEAARQTAVGELHAHAASLATEIARRILKREIAAGDQQRLVEESLQQLQSMHRN